jgi:hypothetical protein
MIVVVIYDIICMKFKYVEGYRCTVEATTNVTVAKLAPKAIYSAFHVDLVNSANALWSVACVTKTSAMFLINAMWHNISRKVFQASFMSSFEFRGYLFYSIGSVLLYPIFQYIFLYDSTLTTIAPQFVYSVEVLIIGCLSQYSNLRFRKFNGAGGNQSIDFYIVINNYLSLGCFMDCIGLATINIASASLHPLLPFELDFLSHIFNIGFIMEYAVLFFIIYPPSANALPPTKGARGSKSTAGIEMQSLEVGRSKSPSLIGSVSQSEKRATITKYKNDASKNDAAIKSDSMKNDAIKNDAIKNDAIKNDAIQLDAV